MTCYEKIYEKAADNYGFITTAEASELGVPKQEMSALAKRNRLVHHGYGVYRLATHYLPTPYDGFAEALLLVGGEESAIWGESVLALHELALVNPPAIEVATVRRIRRTLPAWVKVVREKVESPVYYQGIRCQNLADAFRSCRNTVLRERLLDGIEKAQANGDLRIGEYEQLMKEFHQ